MEPNQLPRLGGSVRERRRTVPHPAGHEAGKIIKRANVDAHFVQLLWAKSKQ